MRNAQTLIFEEADRQRGEIQMTNKRIKKISLATKACIRCLSQNRGSVPAVVSVTVTHPVHTTKAFPRGLSEKHILLCQDCLDSTTQAFPFGYVITEQQLNPEGDQK